jgi:hypothetical protein
MQISRSKIVSPLLFLGLVASLDISLEKATCDSTLPVTADIYMKCENGARCTFGDSVNLYGTCK